MIEHIIIGLTIHEPLTGYDIKKKIETGIGNFVKASHGSLYPALKKLTGKGFLTMEELPQGNRIKKYYQATEAGKEAFLEWLTSPVDPNAVTLNVLSKVFFFNDLPDDQRQQLIQTYELHIQQILDAYKKMEQELTMTKEEEKDYYGTSTLYYGLQATQGMLRWLKYIKGQKPLTEFIKEED